jgi:RNA polymerase sigma-70 factor (ECF subfamily)
MYYTSPVTRGCAILAKCAAAQAKIDNSRRLRTVFVLRAVEEMTAEGAGVCLGIPPATVRTASRQGTAKESAREIDFSMHDAFRFDGERCDRIVAGVLGRLKGLPRESS